MNINIKYKNDIKEFKKGTSYYEIVKAFNAGKDVIACKVSSVVTSLSEKSFYDEEIEFVTINSFEGRNVYKSALKFIFIVAIKQLFKDYEVYFEHSIPGGMVAEIKGKSIISNTDFTLIKEKVNDLIKEDHKFVHSIIRKKEGIMLYNNTNQLEKANNITNIIDPVVSIYEFCGEYNYFYSELPYSSSSIINYEIVYLGKNKFIFLLPDLEGNAISYIHHEKILNSFNDKNNWLTRQKTPYFEDLNLNVGNGKIKKFIESNEIYFKNEIQKVVNEIKSNTNCKLIMLAGPSSSGKTTTSKLLSSYLNAEGYETLNLSTDDYYLSKEFVVDNDYEKLEAIDLEHFNTDLDLLLKGESIKLPRYDFITGKKEIGDKEIKAGSNAFIIIEGLHSLNDKLTNFNYKEIKYKVYLSPFTAINIDRHNYVSSIDLRLIRRIVRDNRTRGYAVAKTIHNWQTVRAGEEKYIFPFINEANVIINTALEFELGVLKVYVEPLLLSVNISSPYYAEARRLLSSLKQFFPISSKYVHDDSILREFIGGRYE